MLLNRELDVICRKSWHFRRPTETGNLLLYHHMKHEPLKQINKLIGTPVGADLSRPSPIYRPSVDFPIS
jgi:hypothetical protein